MYSKFQQRDGKTKFVIIAGVAVALAGAVYLTKRMMSSPVPEKKATSEGEECPAPKPVARKVKKKVVRKPEAEISKLIQESYAMLNQGQVTGPLIEELLKNVLSVGRKPEIYTASFRIEAAGWLIIYNTICLFSCQSQEELDKLTTTQKTYMGLAWGIIDFADDDTTVLSKEEKERSLMLKMDLAQRLRKQDVLASMLDGAIELATANTQDPTMLVICFTTCPTLGRWDTFLELGRLLISRGQAIDEFHAAAAQRPDMPDFATLYEMAQEDPTIQSGEPAWEAFNIESSSIMFNRCDTTDAKTRESIASSFAQKPGFQPMQMQENARVIRSGAIMQCVGISSLPVPMVGPHKSDRVHVRGIYSAENPTVGKTTQFEDYDLHQVGGSNDYVGSFTITQTAAGMPSVTMVFDMKMTLSPTEYPL